jgi:uncharacterized phage protein gp47/JayE
LAQPTSTLHERERRIRGDINSRLPGADAGIPRTAEYAIGRALAGGIHGLQGVGEWLAKQVVPGPDSDASTLEQWLITLGSPRKVAERSTGVLRIFGDDATPVPAGTEFQKADGTVVDTDALVTIVDQGGSNYIDAAVTAVETGTEGNAEIGTTLTLVSPAAGVDSEATVQDDGEGSGLTGGTAIESRDEMWVRVQQRFSYPPGAGTEADYERWALEVSGVTRAWAQGQALGAGTVRVLFVRDNDASIIPDGAEVAAVQAYIDDDKAPVTANVTVAAPTAKTLNYQIANITDATARDNIDSALEDYILRAGEPGGTLPIEELIGAVDLAVGSTGFDLVSPAADVTHTTLELPVHGTITWI